MHSGYDQLGEVFTVPVAHKRVTFLIGPDVAPHFFKATDDEMSQTEVCGLGAVLGGGGWRRRRRKGRRRKGGSSRPRSVANASHAMRDTQASPRAGRSSNRPSS
jgi:hypothetical protein